jgi:CHAT domain-containing protein/tetratricopeptide (TPR) repeat protein
MTSSSESSLLYKAIQELAKARTRRVLQDSLVRYRFLLDINADLDLTRMIRACPRRSDIVKISILFVIRDFLTRLRTGSSLEAAQKAIGGLPLYEYDPIGQLGHTPQPSPDQVGLCRRALTLVRPDTEPDLWAYLHFLLANRLLLASHAQLQPNQHPQDFYLLPTDAQTIERLATNIQEAIEAYQAAGEVWEKCGNLKESAKARYELARLLIDFTAGEQRAYALQRAIKLLESTLTIWKKDTHPQQWGQVQAALGLALENNPAGLDATTLEQAIEYFKAALKIPLNSPFEQARLEYHLAILYTQRYGNEWANHIEQAIELLRGALEIRTISRYPKEWADTQNSLANALQKRLRGDPAQNIEAAVSAYQVALEVWTYNQNPDRWAMIQRNLAEAYRQRILGQPEENQQIAINHFQNALKVYTEQNYPGEWASIRNSLANLYCHSSSGNRTEAIEQGISHHQQALRVYKQANYPRQWAQTLNNLANAYCDRLEGDHATNLQEAIRLYQQALEVRTYEDYPHEWAATHNNLGTAYADLHQWNQAIEHFNQALKVRTISTLPDKTLQTARNLGNVYFNLGRWDEAIDAFEKAQAASDALYRQAITTVGKRAEISRGGAITQQLAYALAKKGDFNEVVVKLEQGRARLLAEVLARDRAILDQVNKGDRSEYEKTVEAIRALNRELQAAELHVQGSSAGSTTARSFVVIADELAKANDKLSNIVARIQKYEHGFLSKELNFETLAKSIPADKALVYLVTTSHSSLALIVPSQAGSSKVTNLDKRHIVWLNEFRIDNLHSSLFGSFLEGSLGDPSQWEKTNILPELLITLGKHLMAPLAQRLHDLGLKHIVLVPTGHLALLPLHAATYPVNGHEWALVDEFIVTYAPSARSLSHSQAAVSLHPNGPSTFFGVGNPLPLPEGVKPLASARAEVEEIVSLFGEGATALYETQATHSAVEAGLGTATYLHLACHGQFIPAQPLDSGLILSGGDRLTLRDMLARPPFRVARLAVLSACQTAITDFNQLPDEAIGLPAGFLQAGVPGVVGTLWSVDDLSTALLMIKFYEYHRQGDQATGIEPMPPAMALRQAQCWLRAVTAAELLAYFSQHKALHDAERDRERLRMPAAMAAKGVIRFSLLFPEKQPFAEPYYWAPFIFVGA